MMRIKITGNKNAHHVRDLSSVCTSAGGRDQNDRIAAHIKHGNVAFGGPIDLFVGFFVDLNGGDGLFNISQNHI